MSTPKFMFIRAVHNEQPVGAVAFIANGDTLSYGYSAQHPDEKWNRSRSYQMAMGRCLKRPININMPGVGMLGHHALMVAVMACLSGDETAPNRVRKTAKHWIYNHNS